MAPAARIFPASARRGAPQIGGVALLLVLLIGACLAAPATASARAPDPRILPPDAPGYGKTYGEWAAAFWQWLAGQTADQARACGPSATAPVWLFDPGPLTPGPARSCTLPADAPLFLPIYAVECSELEGSGISEAPLRACANELADALTAVEARLDGVVIPDARQYRAQSPLFTFTVPDNNYLGLPAGTTPAVADGYWLLLAPLAPGAHTLTLRAAGDPPSDEPPFDLTATFALTVTATAVPGVGASPSAGPSAVPASPGTDGTSLPIMPGAGGGGMSARGENDWLVLLLLVAGLGTAWRRVLERPARRALCRPAAGPASPRPRYGATPRRDARCNGQHDGCAPGSPRLDEEAAC